MQIEFAYSFRHQYLHVQFVLFSCPRQPIHCCLFRSSRIARTDDSSRGWEKPGEIKRETGKREKKAEGKREADIQRDRDRESLPLSLKVICSGHMAGSRAIISTTLAFN